MKILWVTTNFLHPTTKGGQIRTLGMLRWLHRWHDVHVVAMHEAGETEGRERAREYASEVTAIERPAPARRMSARFWWEVVGSLTNAQPLAVSRHHPPGTRERLRELLARERFDRAVVDFLAPAAYYPDLPRALLFQHNVETMIWRRHAEHARNPVERAYFASQARKMFRFERDVCRTVAHTVAVSEADAQTMRSLFGVETVSAVATGVDVDYFARPGEGAAAPIDLVFVGSMDWMPNVDGVDWFLAEVLPLIRERRPEATVAIVGRTPPARLADRKDIVVTGTVPDVRPYLWRGRLSIVPLRIGGGTRLKIYESMAAGLPVVSTTVGAEGLDVAAGRDITLADDARGFAAECVRLLEDEAARRVLAEAALARVTGQFSWEQVTRSFERTLIEKAPALS
ncbi:MAG: glycosyltransferase family 4 protein [Bryobacteraceae bacterium]|nr:glycosyltransferase family 4 protein [Bryobacteraceae bacterium]